MGAKKGFYSKMVKRSTRFVKKSGNRWGPARTRTMRSYRYFAPNKAVIKTRYLPEGLPRRLKTKLSYDLDRQTISGLAGGASTGAIKIRVNGPYDPEYASGGAQPPLWDNYTALYGAYIVNSVTIKARVENWSSVPQQVALLCVFDPTTNTPSFPDAIATYDINALDRSQRSKVKFVASASGASGNVIYLKKTFYPSQIVGRNYFSDVTYAGLAGGLPASEVIAELLCRSQDAGLAAWGSWVNIRLTYNVTFYDRKETEIAAYD